MECPHLLDLGRFFASDFGDQGPEETFGESLALSGRYLFIGHPVSLEGQGFTPEKQGRVYALRYTSSDPLQDDGIYELKETIVSPGSNAGWGFGYSIDTTTASLYRWPFIAIGDPSSGPGGANEVFVLNPATPEGDIPNYSVVGGGPITPSNVDATITDPKARFGINVRIARKNNLEGSLLFAPVDATPDDVRVAIAQTNYDDGNGIGAVHIAKNIEGVWGRGNAPIDASVLDPEGVYGDGLKGSCIGGSICWIDQFTIAVSAPLLSTQIARDAGAIAEIDLSTDTPVLRNIITGQLPFTKMGLSIAAGSYQRSNKVDFFDSGYTPWIMTTINNFQNIISTDFLRFADGYSVRTYVRDADTDNLVHTFDQVGFGDNVGFRYYEQGSEETLNRTSIHTNGWGFSGTLVSYIGARDTLIPDWRQYFTAGHYLALTDLDSPNKIINSNCTGATIQLQRNLDPNGPGEAIGIKVTNMEFDPTVINDIRYLFYDQTDKMFVQTTSNLPGIAQFKYPIELVTDFNNPNGEITYSNWLIKRNDEPVEDTGQSADTPYILEVVEKDDIQVFARAASTPIYRVAIRSAEGRYSETLNPDDSDSLYMDLNGDRYLTPWLYGTTLQLRVGTTIKVYSPADKDNSCSFGLQPASQKIFINDQRIPSNSLPYTFTLEKDVTIEGYGRCSFLA